MLDVRGLLGQHTWCAAAGKAAVVVAEFRRRLCHSSPLIIQWVEDGSGERVGGGETDQHDHQMAGALIGHPR